MTKHAHKARSVAGRARRRLAEWAAPGVHAELRDVRRKLRASRRELRDVRARLDAATHALPEEVEQAIAQARAEHLTYLKPNNLRELASAVRQLERDGLPGLVVEAGTARGGSAIVMAA